MMQRESADVVNVDLVHERQQMLMARPWEAAEDWSIWEITGESPRGRFSFDRMLAQAVPTEGGIIFLPLGGFVDIEDAVAATWITRAVPLALVHRDNGAPYRITWEGPFVR